MENTEKIIKKEIRGINNKAKNFIKPLDLNYAEPREIFKKTNYLNTYKWVKYEDVQDCIDSGLELKEVRIFKKPQKIKLYGFDKKEWNKLMGLE